MKPSTPLRKVRRARDITQEELAEMSGVAQQTICKLERGRTKPTWETAFRISRALGVEPSQLFPVAEAREALAS